MLRNALSAARAKHLPKGKYADGSGLWLFKSRPDAGKWVQRLTVNGRRREMGLGRWPEVSISEAREKSEDARRLLRNGIDPIDERAKSQRHSHRLTVAEAIESCFTARQAELKGDGKAGRWLSPLKNHVIPKIGHLAIEDVDQHVLKRTLEPIWHSKADTARKASNRINLTLQHAAALGLDVDLQAILKAQALLGKQRYKAQHIASIPYAEAPSFYKWLCTKDFTSALALRFLMLTVARTTEIRGARFCEINEDIWSIPAERTKSGREHRIPLTEEAMHVVAAAQVSKDQDVMFPSPTGKIMSDAAMSRFMEREGYTARPHGFRATFRTWVEEQTDTPFEIKESALSHKVDSGIVEAYQRSDRLEKRRKLMEAWTDFLCQ